MKNSTRNILIISGLLVWGFIAYRAHKLISSVTRTSESVERIVEDVGELTTADGVLENVDVRELGQGLTEGAKEVGQAWKEKLKPKDEK